MDCPCAECSRRRAFTEKIKQLREEFRRTIPGWGEFDWEDLEKQCRAYEEWKRCQRRSNG